MRKNKSFWILTISFLLTPSLFASEAIRNSTLFPDLVPEKTGAKINAEAKVQAGSTSNIGKINKPVSGTFLAVEPSASAKIDLWRHIRLDAKAAGLLRNFSNSSAQALGKEARGQGTLDGTWFITDKWRVGGYGDFTYADYRTPAISGRNVNVIEQKYTQTEARGRAGWAHKYLSFEIGATNTDRRYLMPTYDLQGNSFLDSYKEQSAYFHPAYAYSENVEISLTNSAGIRRYTERMAEYSNGLPIEKGFRHPKLAEIFTDHELATLFRIYDARVKSSYGGRYNKDLVYGARDSFQVRTKHAVLIPLFYKFSASLEAAYAFEQFIKFSRDPVAGTKATKEARRADHLIGSALGLNYLLNKTFIIDATYAYNHLISNYDQKDYLEHVVQTGVSLQY